MSSRHVAAPLLAAALTLGLLSAPARSDDAWRVVVRVAGHVESRQPAQPAWSPIWRSRVLSDGDRARTLQASRATVRLADQSEFTVGADSEVEMTKFALTPEGRTVVFNLWKGRIRARVAKVLGKQNRFEVRTPNGVLAARGTEFYVEQTAPQAAAQQPLLASRGAYDVAAAPPPANGDTVVIVFSGRVDATTPGGGHQVFLPGDYGILTPGGVIFVNPPSFHPGGPLGAQGPDQDMREPHGTGGNANVNTPGSAYQTSIGTFGPTRAGTSERSEGTEFGTGVNAPPPIFSPNQQAPHTGSVPVIINNR